MYKLSKFDGIIIHHHSLKETRFRNSKSHRKTQNITNQLIHKRKEKKILAAKRRQQWSFKEKTEVVEYI